MNYLLYIEFIIDDEFDIADNDDNNIVTKDDNINDDNDDEIVKNTNVYNN